MSWPRRIIEEVAASGPLVRVTVIRAEGSTPREIGAAMLVGAGGITETIGGGALEFEAVAHARAILAGAAQASPWQREGRDLALGPSLGQCCGGMVRLMFELFTERECAALGELAGSAPYRPYAARPLESGVPLRGATSGGGELPPSVARAIRASHPQAGALPRALLIPGRKGEPDWFVELLTKPARPLVLYGAGHVGRALVRVLEGLPFLVNWVDTDAARFPAPLPAGVTMHAAADPAAIIGEFPADAFHIVMTYSHPLDLAICHAVLSRGAFGFLGLIGSQTKCVRFSKRLRELGIAEERLARLVCPIGVPGIMGKQPAVIAVAVAAQLLQELGRMGAAPSR